MSDDNLLQIEIESNCTLDPQHPTMSPTGANQVQWYTEHGKTFALLLPGGIFENHPSTFPLAVHGTTCVPDPPLKLVAKPPKTVIKDYVYDEDGMNCTGDKGDDPPDIVIDS